jgi:glycerol-3-phosphate dehydrogenase (NAD(P)+)
MGTACALILTENPDHDVALWSLFPENASEFAAKRENTKFLPGVPLPERVTLTADLAEAADGADLLLVAVPMIYLRETLEKIGPELVENRPAVSIIKGIEQQTFLRASEVICEVLGARTVCALSGPSHAEELARRLPATLVAASGDITFARRVQAMFSTDRLRVYTNADVLGVELAGALKNVLGIAAGICDGLGFGDNAKAALMTRGVVEMTRFGMAMGAEAQTFGGLAGIGDLITTCISPFGRNRAVGEAIGKGRKLPEILQDMHQVAEGIWTSRAVHEMAENKGVDMPITREVFQALFEDKDPLQAVSDLMLRTPRDEAEPQTDLR